MTVNALVASTHAILSTEAQYFSHQGMEQAVQVLDLARDSLNPELELLGVCLNIANMRTRHAHHTLEALPRAVRRQALPDRDPAVDRVRRVGRTSDSHPRVPPRQGGRLLSLAGEILRRLGKQEMLEELERLMPRSVPAGPRQASAPAPKPAATAPEPADPAPEPTGFERAFPG